VELPAPALAELSPSDHGEIDVKRFVAVLGLLVMPVIGFSADAGAVGYGACTISGTITFTAETVTAGTWSITPAVIDCQGLIAARRRIIGRGPFKGSGTYEALPPGDSACLRQTGTGKIEYDIPTTGGEISVTEPWDHRLAGIGTISTPTLRGAFQVNPAGGDCLTKPVTRAAFVAEVSLLRYPRQLPNPDRLPYLS
jgi:hypothetical protein